MPVLALRLPSRYKLAEARGENRQVNDVVWIKSRGEKHLRTKIQQHEWNVCAWGVASVNIR